MPRTMMARSKLLTNISWLNYWKTQCYRIAKDWEEKTLVGLEVCRGTFGCHDGWEMLLAPVTSNLLKSPPGNFGATCIWACCSLFLQCSSHPCVNCVCFNYYYYCSNMYTTKFTILTILKYTIQWHFVHSQCCATIITIYFQNSFIIPKETLYPWSSYFPFPPAPSPSSGNH